MIIIFIKIESKGPILFRQKRVGKNKKLFNIYKFRTMRIDAPANTPTHMLENPDQWITKVGRFLRKTSLDETPQLINIIIGNMSIIGPRPALWNQYDLIEERDKYGVNILLPGITGWAQVNGRDILLISDKAKLDGEYLKHFNLWTDIKIFIRTFIIVFKKEGIVEGRTGSHKT
jgi:O-antigen biosynthesis protein WbqP